MTDEESVASALLEMANAQADELTAVVYLASVSLRFRPGQSPAQKRAIIAEIRSTYQTIDDTLERQENAEAVLDRAWHAAALLEADAE